MSTLEADVGIVCACMPAMQLLLRRVAPRIFGSSVDNSSYLHPYSGANTKTYRNTNGHHPQSKNITMTRSVIVTDMPKDSDSVIELVDNTSKSRSAEGGSIATFSTDAAHKHHNW